MRGVGLTPMLKKRYMAIHFFRFNSLVYFLKGMKMPKASVKVMRSYDYCHFEICLSSDQEMNLVEINEMRKDAAILVDEAVRQYIVAKDMANKKIYRDNEKQELTKQIEIIKTKPESEWTAEEKAKVKALEDHDYWQAFDYRYDDEQEGF